MVKMQHKTRREGGITVGDPPARYQLDPEGIVEVTEEHGRMLAGTGMWAPVGTWPKDPAVKAVVDALPGVGRAPRTRAELEAAAAAEGIPIKPATPSPVPPPPSAPPVPEPETIEVSPDMPLEKLRGVAKELGLKVPKRATQAELFELIRTQGEQA